MPDLPNPFLPDDWDLDVRSLELVHRETGARVGVTDAHIDALLGLTPGSTQALRAQYNGVVGSAKAVGERVSELLRRTELPGVVDIGASLAEELVRRGPVERAAELMTVRGVGWTRLERILRAFYANVGVAPAAVADDAPLVAPAEVEALWAGPMGRAGGRAGWSLAQEALVMVHGAGLGALSPLRLGQLAAALRGLVDAGTLEREALLGAVGPLIRRWMEQGEPEETGESGEPSGAPPAPEEAGEDPFPEGRPLPPEEFLHGRRYDILVISYDVFTRTFRLVLLLADAVWDRPGVVPDAGVTPTAAQIAADPAHATKRGLPAAAAGQATDFISPTLPGAEAVFAAILARFELDTLFILSLGTMLSNPTEVRQGSKLDAWPGYRAHERLGFGLEERAATRAGWAGALVLRDLSASLRWSQQGGVSDRLMLGRVDGKNELIRPTKMYPTRPELHTPRSFSWNIEQQTSLLFGRRQRAGAPRAYAQYEHLTEPLADACAASGRVQSNPNAQGRLNGSLGSVRVMDRSFGARPGGTLDQTTTAPTVEVVGVGGAGAAAAGAGSWSALGVKLPRDPTASLPTLTAGPDAPSEAATMSRSIPLTSSTYKEHIDGASPGAPAAAGDHKLIWISGSRGELSAERLVDQDEDVDSQVEAELVGTQPEVAHTTVMTVQEQAPHGYVLRLGGEDLLKGRSLEPETPPRVQTVPPGGRWIYERSQRGARADVVGSLTVLGGSGRQWTIEHRVVDETLTIDDRQSCELVSVTVLDPNATDPEKHLKVQRDPHATRGELRNLCAVTRTSRSLFLRR